MNSIMQRRKAVLKKLNKNRQVYWHDFKAEDGFCSKCSKHFCDVIEPNKPITNLQMLCAVIGREEVAQFRTDPI